VDPQETWKDLLRAVDDIDVYATNSCMVNLWNWLEQGGFAPTVHPREMGHREYDDYDSFGTIRLTRVRTAFRSSNGALEIRAEGADLVVMVCGSKRYEFNRVS
jgi:hypothetical protein